MKLVSAKDMGACRSPHGCNRIVQPLPRPTTTGPKTVLRASAPKGLTGMQHQKAARRSGAQGRHPVHNSLGYGRECGICSAFGKFLDEVTPFLQAPGKLGIQGDRACNDKGQEKADKMAQWVKVLAPKPDNLSSLSGTHRVEIFPTHTNNVSKSWVWQYTHL